MKYCIFRGLLLGVMLLLFVNRAGAQEGVNVTAGLGLPELFNLGLRMQLNQSQLGIAVGTDLFGEDDNIALSGDFYYHFGGNSEYTTLRPWFIKSGLTYLRSENEWKRNTMLFLVPRVGREFNLSSKFGIALEAGILFILYDHEKVLKENPDSWFDFDLDFAGVVLPSAGLNFYYRF